MKGSAVAKFRMVRHPDRSALYGVGSMSVTLGSEAQYIYIGPTVELRVDPDPVPPLPNGHDDVHDGEAPDAEQATLPAAITLDTLSAQPYWVAWRPLPRNGEVTKIPFSPVTHRRAEADEPKTWGTRPEAERADKELPSSTYGQGGVGLEFTTLPDGRATAGIDLDTCRDPETGQ